MSESVTGLAEKHGGVSLVCVSETVLLTVQTKTCRGYLDRTKL